MTIPSAMQFTIPLLRYLAANPDGGTMADVCLAVADAVGVTEEERKETLPSGTDTVFRNRTAWAQWYLKTAGLSSAPKQGWWKITPAGVEFAGRTDITGEEVKRLSDGARSSKPKRTRVAGKQKERDAEVLALHNQGMRHSEIAEKLSLPHSTVYDSRVRLGIVSAPTRASAARISEDINHAVSAACAALALRLESLTEQIEATGLVADEKEIKQWIRDLSNLGRTAKAMRTALSQRLHNQ